MESILLSAINFGQTVSHTKVFITYTPQGLNLDIENKSVQPWSAPNSLPLILCGSDFVYYCGVQTEDICVVFVSNTVVLLD